MDELVAKHKKERKELQAKIQAIKKSVPKGDKKRKKESNEEIAKLESELNQRHEEEIKALQSTSIQEEEELAAKLDDTSLNDKPETGSETRVSKAQRRREKKAALNRERDQRIAEEEASNVNSARKIEYEKIKNILKKRNLTLKEISTDGHCLYRAVADQLSRVDINTTVERLRKQTADFMRSHPDDFMAFLSNPNTQEPLTAEEFEKYCHDVESTAAWGGQLEISAMSNILHVPVEVIQADGPIIITGEHFTAPSVILSYHRHAYGLGEHYNSVVPVTKTDQSGDEDGFS